MVPWCAWAMLAFSLANVLVSNLLAQGRFTIVPWTVLVVAAFLGTLAWMAPLLLEREPIAAFRLVAMAIGGFNLLLLGIAALLTWGGRRATQPTP